MSETDAHLNVVPARQGRAWLFAGVMALAVAGLFALVLVIARSPGISNLPYFKDMFHKALVVHVDLSVLVWFFCIAGMCWSMGASVVPKKDGPVGLSLQRYGCGTMLAGAILIALSAFDVNAVAMMSNYVPVITSQVFFMGLALAVMGTVMSAVHILMHARIMPKGADSMSMAVQLGIHSSAWIALVSVLALVASYVRMPEVIEGEQYFDLLFWGGGHVLQFMHVQLMMVCWLWLTMALYPGLMLRRGLMFVIMMAGPVAVLFTPVAYIKYEVADQAFRQFFTGQMIMGLGIAPGVLALVLGFIAVVAGKGKPESRALRSSLICSLVLFFAGGFIGMLIEGQDARIPAHYHGSIVAVTLAFMGAAYLFLPYFGYAPVEHTRLAYWQPFVYGGGQLLHIIGLAWSGGYGALRKTPGTDSLPPDAVAAMGLMGLGGLLAIIGGLIFVIVIARGVWQTKKFRLPAASS